MSLTYNTFVTSLANLIVVSPVDVGYVTALPNIIDDAEQRLYRELDLLSTVTRDTAPLVATTAAHNGGAGSSGSVFVSYPTP
jgi:hypothetical protein